MNSILDGLSVAAQLLDRASSLLSIQAGYKRRKEDWDFQAQVADMEKNQLEKQLIAAEIRLMIAEKELENMDLQIEQSQVVNEFYKDKFTNEQLYNWMITEISKVYLYAYKLAYDMAKKAELCYRNELGIFDEKVPYFINFVYWDSLKKGLLAGDRLMHDLHRLDAAYIDKNKRALELTKHISLAEMFPEELVKLITTKSTELELPEWLFDMDYPGHYMRRIKSVSVTIPNVAGPHTTVSFRLELQKSAVRKKDKGTYDTDYDPYDIQNDEFERIYATNTICTSSAQNDSGLFELNFGDERYLPFENAGVISEWGLSFPAGCDQFDLSTVSDVILHINYTAIESSDLKEASKAHLDSILPDNGRMFFSLKHGFSTEWNQLGESNKEMNFELTMEHLPFFLRGKANELIVDSVASVLVSKKENLYNNLNSKTLILTNDESITITLNKAPMQNGDLWLYECACAINNNQKPKAKGEWTANLDDILGEIAPNDVITPDDIEDIIIGFNLLEVE